MRTGIEFLSDLGPILVVLLGVIGLGALTGYLDYILLPTLTAFLGLTVYALVRQKQTEAASCCENQDGKERGDKQ